MKTRILVTGGAGFIGACVIDKMVRQGFEVASLDAELNFIDNDPYYRLCLAIRKKIYKQPAKLYVGDIRNKEDVEHAIADFGPGIVIHLAGLPMARTLAKFENDMIPINMTGTLNVLDVFEKSKAEKIIFTSSSMAYGHFRQTPQSENFILNPVNAYGACKAASEYFVKLSKKSWVILRPTSVYGFTDCANRVSQLLIDAASLGKRAWVVRGETLDFSYIDDVADGFLLAASIDEANGETFNISRGEARGSEEFAEILKHHFPAFQYEVKEPVAGQVFRGPQDIAKAQKILGFSPKYSIEQGIEKVLQLAAEYKFYEKLNS